MRIAMDICCGAQRARVRSKRPERLGRPSARLEPSSPHLCEPGDAGSTRGDGKRRRVVEEGRRSALRWSSRAKGKAERRQRFCGCRGKLENALEKTATSRQERASACPS